MNAFEKSLDKLTRKVDDLNEKIAQELEDELQRAVLILSSQYPNDLVTGCSAMGTWDISRRTPNDEFGQSDYIDSQIPKYLDEIFERVSTDYTFSAIPVVLIEARGGKLRNKRKDW